MSRGLPAPFAATVQSPHVDWFWLVEMQLQSGTLRLCGLDFDVQWSGHTWTAMHGLGQIAPIEEVPGQVTGITFTLAGVTTAHIAVVLAEPVQGRPAIIRLAVLDRSTEPPAVAVDGGVWQGLLDVQRYSEADATVTVTAENRLIEWDRPRLTRYSHEDQIRRFPGDGFFKLQAQMEQKTIILFSKAALERG
ncbi:hypothetical protein [Ralstonia sp.]|uniref:hypothetical protein n=2 Tax=Ralstonia sp. TaxID=54061 RepID=UPI00257A492D|nr:hypothetical protein [Ralstonia sp.]MBA4203132.1 hypothetical protein [Ralstonia sp.]MBA4282333.1 hypothetical protein [Ralstonia sp.]